MKSRNPNPGSTAKAPRIPTLILLVSAFSLFSSTPALAFPPSPDHVISGVVRDELGNPLINEKVEVVLTTDAGVKIRTTIRLDLPAGSNYRLSIPLDSGLTAEPYKPTALRPTAPFTLSVTIGTKTYLPIEMVGNLMNLGQPAGETRLDLTLGEDLDGDGLPDAWERALLTAGQTLADIRPGDDTDGDGISNLLEYLAGTYAFDPNDGFTLKVAGVSEGRPQLEFTVLRGRNYTILGSTDLKTWEPVVFRVPAEGADAPLRKTYQAADVRLLRVAAETTTDAGPTYFKLILR